MKINRRASAPPISISPIANRFRKSRNHLLFAQWLPSQTGTLYEENWVLMDLGVFILNASVAIGVERK
jgi:hypothetical protein